jgi:hypothetical protein
MRARDIGRSLAAALTILASVSLTAASGASTSPVSPTPIVNTGYADQLGQSAATLRGSISPDGGTVSYYFEYGSTQAYGARTPTSALGTGAKTIHVSAAVSGLSPYTTYHFRLVAVRAGGSTSGADHTFTTARVPLSITINARPNPVVFGKPILLTGTLSGTGNAAHPVAVQANPFPYRSGFKYATAPVLTTATGIFSLVLGGLSQNTEVRVAAAGAPVTYSPPVRELVAVRVSFHVRPARRRGFVRLYGAVAPSVLGARVTFQSLRGKGTLMSTGGSTTKRGTANAARFDAVIRLRHRGLYRAFVAVANGRQVSGSSRVIAIRPR